MLVDNFSAHVTDSSKALVASQLCSKLVELPANCTSVCQPLDVGVMGPFKSRLRALWLEEMFSMDDNTVVLTAKEKRRRVILRAIRAWESLSEDVVRDAFEKAIPTPSVAI